MLFHSTQIKFKIEESNPHVCCDRALDARHPQAVSDALKLVLEKRQGDYPTICTHFSSLLMTCTMLYCDDLHYAHISFNLHEEDGFFLDCKRWPHMMHEIEWHLMNVSFGISTESCLLTAFCTARDTRLEVWQQKTITKSSNLQNLVVESACFYQTCPKTEASRTDRVKQSILWSSAFCDLLTLRQFMLLWVIQSTSCLHKLYQLCVDKKKKMEAFHVTRSHEF